MAQEPHTPTDDYRRQVEALAGYGVRREIIADAIGVGVVTLRKYYERELALGDAKAQGQIAKAAFDKAIQDKDTAMIIWLTKTRLKWKDLSRVEVTGEGGGPVKGEIIYRVVDPAKNE